MADIMQASSSQRGMRSEAARRRIAAFGKRFGPAHLSLAQHAAFPLALTPDLLYRLWANFQRNVRGEKLKIPWIAVADLLLSPLCDEVDHELYEMNVAIRAELLSALKANPDFGQQRINELSSFLLDYIQQQLYSSDPDIRNFAQVQRWTALAYTQPGKVARELASALIDLDQNDRVEQIRIASLIDTFAEPLASFAPLLTYARGMSYLARGEVEAAREQFRAVGETGQTEHVLGVRLPVPERINEGIVEIEMQTSVLPHTITPNALLRNERVRRGWTLAYVAERIGANSKTVGRWEGRVAYPSPHFRQKLAELFGMSLAELGLVRGNVDKDEKREEAEEHKEISNTQLRSEREARGWTQEEVAEKIGITSFTINRWESGITYPSRHYRQELMELFSKSLEELGLVRDFFVSYHDADRDWAEWIAWQLEEAGYSIMMRDWNFQPGADFTHEIDSITDIARHIIIVLSPDYLSAFAHMPSWAAAFDQDPRSRDISGTLIAIHVRECIKELENLLGPIAYIDLVRLDEEEASRKLYIAIDRVQSKPGNLMEKVHHTLTERPSFPRQNLKSPAIVLPKNLHIFVSYSQQDRVFAVKLAQDLRQVLSDSNAVWYDDGLHVRDSWQKEIMKELLTCNVFIVILSPSAIRSSWVKYEMDIALRQRLTRGKMLLIPLLYQSCDIPVHLQTIQVANFLPHRSYEEAFNNLLLALGGVPEKTKEQWKEEGDAHYNAGKYEEALTAYENVLALSKQVSNIFITSLNDIGNIYLAQGNTEQAIARYQEALQICTRESFPMEYARIQTNLGNAYRERIAGSKQDNLQQAITCYQEALKILTLGSYPEECARIQVNLGDAYFALKEGGQETNLESAIFCYQAALRVYTSNTSIPTDNTSITQKSEIQQKLENAEYAYQIVTGIPKIQKLLALSSSDINDIEEEVLAKIRQEEFLMQVAQAIVRFPARQRAALLMDLANRMDFGEFTPLERAFFVVGIRLEDYRKPLPNDPKERSRHASLVSLAYKRLRSIVQIDNKD